MSATATDIAATVSAAAAADATTVPISGPGPRRTPASIQPRISQPPRSPSSCSSRATTAGSGSSSTRSTRPACRNTARSQNRVTCGSCVTITTVVPSAAPRSSRSTPAAVCGSSAPVGSSAKITSGRVISARAMAARCCWPPDSSAGRRRSWPPPRPTRAAASSMSSRPAGRWSSRSGSAMFSATVSSGSRLRSWNTKPTRLPPQHRLPAVGEPGQVRPAQPDRAGRGPLEPGRALQQRRLAGPGDAEHRGERARRERQRHPVQRRRPRAAAARSASSRSQHYRRGSAGWGDSPRNPPRGPRP